MKLKQDPEDFKVEELTEVTPGEHGPFAFYRMTKRGWTTPDALAAIRRRWQVDACRLSYGGLKDRHAHTVQYLAIHRGPRCSLTHHGVTLQYLGQIDGPYTSRDIRANRFSINLRDLTTQQAQSVVAASTVVCSDGVPNYFDDQRFGSIAGGGEFVGKLMVAGRWEAALKLALTAPYEHDRARQKDEKTTLLTHWGRWAECKERLPRGHARSVVDYLAHHPVDFRGAVARLRTELQGLYLSAYQSHLWNRILAAHLNEVVPPAKLRSARLRVGELPVPISLDDAHRAELAALTIPLPAARSPFDPDAPWAGSGQQVMAEEGLTWEGLKLKGLRKPFFTRGERAAWCIPDGLIADAKPDERHPDRFLVRLAFELPRGSYATMVVKRLMM
jgi:tRNA pseudouridine13 synthase